MTHCSVSIMVSPYWPWFHKSQQSASYMFFQLHSGCRIGVSCSTKQRWRVCELLDRTITAVQRHVLFCLKRRPRMPSVLLDFRREKIRSRYEEADSRPFFGHLHNLWSVHLSQNSFHILPESSSIHLNFMVHNHYIIYIAVYLWPNLKIFDIQSRTPLDSGATQAQVSLTGSLGWHSISPTACEGICVWSNMSVLSADCYCKTPPSVFYWYTRVLDLI